MEVLAGAGLVNGVVKAVTGKSILQHCGKAVNRLRANVLGMGAEFMGHAVADKALDVAWKAAEAKLAGPDRDERLRFSHHLEALSTILQSVAASRAVEDDSVKMSLDNLRCSLERAFKAAGSDAGRRSSEVDIDGYMQHLQVALATANAKRAEESHDEIREIRQMLSENGLGKVRAPATSAGSTANGTPTAAEADAAASRGDFGLLVDLLRAGTDGAKEQAAGALRSLAFQNADNKVAIVKAGAADPLVDLLRTGTDGAKLQAAGALRSLAWQNADNQVAIVKAGAVDPLVDLLRTGTDGAKEWAAAALDNLALGNAENTVAIAKAGAADPLVGLLRTGTDGAKEQAAAALANLSANVDNQIAIAKAGAVDPLVGLLRTGTDGAKLQAALALKNLARGAESRAAVAQALSLSAAASKSDVAAAVDKLAS